MLSSGCGLWGYLQEIRDFLLRKIIGLNYLFPSSKHSFVNTMWHLETPRAILKTRATTCCLCHQEEFGRIAKHQVNFSVSSRWTFLCPFITLFSWRQRAVEKAAALRTMHPICFPWCLWCLSIVCISVTISLPVFLLHVSHPRWHSSGTPCLLWCRSISCLPFSFFPAFGFPFFCNSYFEWALNSSWPTSQLDISRMHSVCSIWKNAKRISQT